MISDFAARQAALDPERSFIVQAPAGSGKTGLLVYRMLNLLSRAELPQQVLSITFTRKATAEMRERLLELLRLAESKESSENQFEQQGIDLATRVLQRDMQKGWNLLDSPHQLQILTIDSFCAKLTANMPWLSRLGDRPRTTDIAEPHYAAAVEQLLGELLDPESSVIEPLKTVLVELDFDYNKARRLFTSMLAKRDQWLRYLLHNDLDSLRHELESTWGRIVESHIQVLNDLFDRNTLNSLVELAVSGAQVLADKSPDELTPLNAFVIHPVNADAISITHWRGLAHLLVAPSTGKFRKTVNIKLGFVRKSDEKNRLEQYLTEVSDDATLLAALVDAMALPEVHYGELDWQQLVALEKVLKALATRLQLRFRAVGECDHSEVTQRANLALQELEHPTDLGLRMDYHLQHILVDEFQDTSNGQIELLKKLTAGWSVEHDASPRTIFLVGDPMQSIYRFREADVSLFLQVADNANTQIFDNLLIEPLQLSENFRSSGALVSWFNDIFGKSFPQTNNVLTGAIRYAHASSSKTSTQSPLVDCLLAHDRTQEAELLLRSVQQAIKSLPDERAKIAILVRSRSHLSYLLPSLQRAGIEYLGVDIQPLRERQAVIDVLALCKALCREDDRVSWLALLRGPWCGLTLSEIKTIAGRADQTVWQQLKELERDVLDTQSAQRLERFHSVMSLAMAQRQQVELGSLTRWTWNGLGGPDTLFETNPDDLETVFELIEGLQRGGDLSSMNDLNRALDGLFAKPAISAAASAKVVVSTMHKSKGLQFDTVILPALANQARADDKDILMWAEHQSGSGDTGLLLAPLRLSSSDADHYSYLRKLDRQRAANEAIRLMYVATTRAERKLVLIAKADYDEGKGQVKPPPRSSLLANVWESVEPTFDLPLADIAATSNVSELPQTLKRLPADYLPKLQTEIDWQVSQQLSSQSEIQEFDGQKPNQSEIEYEWATAVATGVGIVLHEWLQHNTSNVLVVQLSDKLLQRWRSELRALRVPNDRIEYAVKRLVRAVNNIQADRAAHFLFADYTVQQNEYTLSAFEDGRVNQYRIDRTFIDNDGVRWVVDYKSTDTNNQNVDVFIDQQVAERHRSQLEKYGQLMSKIDHRPIKLAVYFPLLKQLRTWLYSAP